jgi:hypothetical protein
MILSPSPQDGAGGQVVVPGNPRGHEDSGVTVIPAGVTVMPAGVTVIPVRVAETRQEAVQRHAEHHQLRPGAQAEASGRDANRRNTG